MWFWKLHLDKTYSHFSVSSIFILFLLWPISQAFKNSAHFGGAPVMLFLLLLSHQNWKYIFSSLSFSGAGSRLFMMIWKQIIHLGIIGVQITVIKNSTAFPKQSTANWSLKPPKRYWKQSPKQYDLFNSAQELKLLTNICQLLEPSVTF